VSGVWIEIQVVIFWVMTPCSVVVRYQHFGGTCCLLKMEETWPPVQ
jgi:hypothetical protein